MCACNLCVSPKEVWVCVPGGGSPVCVSVPASFQTRIPPPHKQPGFSTTAPLLFTASSTGPSALHPRHSPHKVTHCDTCLLLPELLAPQSPNTTSCLLELVFVWKTGWGGGRTRTISPMKRVPLHPPHSLPFGVFLAPPPASHHRPVPRPTLVPLLPKSCPSVPDLGLTGKRTQGERGWGTPRGQRQCVAG